MKKKYYWIVGIVIVIIIIALIYFIFIPNICNGLQNKLSEEVTKININCNVDSDCVYNTNLPNTNSPCEGLCINKNADLRDYESTQNEIGLVCPVEERSWYLCPNMGPLHCICLQGSCALNHN